MANAINIIQAELNQLSQSNVRTESAFYRMGDLAGRTTKTPIHEAVQALAKLMLSDRELRLIEKGMRVGRA